MVLNHENELQFALWSLENNPDGVFGIDENGSIIYVNHAACNALGYFKEELEGMQVVDFDPLMGSEYFGLGGKMMTALIKKEIRHFKTAHKHRDGHLIPVLITMSIHRREKQAVIICFVRNVEEQEETEKRLRSEIQERQEAENKLLSLNKMLERMAKKDQLTDLWNRRYFFDCVTQEIERVKCYGRNLSLLLVDIDHYKQINDKFGHTMGDTILIKLCRLMEKTVRETDSVIRWGGEEFILLLPETKGWEAAQLAEQLRIEIEQYDFEINQMVTVSVGVAEYSAEDSVDTWIMKADEALYMAKQKGRNLVYTCIPL